MDPPTVKTNIFHNLVGWWVIFKLLCICIGYNLKYSRVVSKMCVQIQSLLWPQYELCFGFGDAFKYSNAQWMVFNTFGPIAFAVELSHGWSDTTLAMMAAVGSASFIGRIQPYFIWKNFFTSLFNFPSAALVPVLWFLQSTDLRNAMLLNTLLILGCKFCQWTLS